MTDSSMTRRDPCPSPGPCIALEIDAESEANSV